MSSRCCPSPPTTPTSPQRGPVPAHARATSKTSEMNLHHFFTFRDGKIAYYRGIEDTAQTEAVLRA